MAETRTLNPVQFFGTRGDAMAGDRPGKNFTAQMEKVEDGDDAAPATETEVDSATPAKHPAKD